MIHILNRWSNWFGGKFNVDKQKCIFPNEIGIFKQKLKKNLNIFFRISMKLNNSMKESKPN